MDKLVALVLGAGIAGVAVIGIAYYINQQKTKKPKPKPSVQCGQTGCAWCDDKSGLCHQGVDCPTGCVCSEGTCVAVVV